MLGQSNFFQVQTKRTVGGEATREARAKVVAAEGEQKSSRALREAADTISQSPAALQLRYLQVVLAFDWSMKTVHTHTTFSTIGVDFNVKTVTIDGDTTVKLQIW